VIYGATNRLTPRRGKGIKRQVSKINKASSRVETKFRYFSILDSAEEAIFEKVTALQIRFIHPY